MDRDRESDFFNQLAVGDGAAVLAQDPLGDLRFCRCEPAPERGDHSVHVHAV